MKWVGFLFIVWFLFVPWSVSAQVVCPSPGTGDSATEGTDINAICHPQAVSGSAVDRDVAVQNIVMSVTDTKSAEPDASSGSRSGGGSGATR